MSPTGAPVALRGGSALSIVGCVALLRCRNQDESDPIALSQFRSQESPRSVRRSPTATPRPSACFPGLGFARRGPWAWPIRAVVHCYSSSGAGAPADGLFAGVRALHAAGAMCSGMVVFDTSRRRLRRAATCWGMTIEVARDVAATASSSRAEPENSATMVSVSPPTRAL